MAKGNGSQCRKHPQETKVAHEVATGAPPVTNSDLDAFLQRLLSHVTQVVQDTVTRTLSQQQKQEGEDKDLCSNLIKIAKMNPSEFEGSTDFIDWLTDMEKLLTAFRCPEEQKVTIATYYLKESAHEWWEACKPTDHDPTWDEFKDKMERRYYPRSLVNAEERKFMEQRPEDETVDEAAKTFYRLLCLRPMIAQNERNKIIVFEMRMSPRIKVLMLGHNCKSLEEYVELALEVESSLDEADRAKGARGNKRRCVPY